jgi:glycosyltransferase involved in cell wall biosynthesis
LDHQKILKKSDIFVLASYADPCSLAVAEACAAGCAIVATSVGGTPELVEFGQAGRLVRPGQPADIAIELNYLMSDRQVLQDWRVSSNCGVDYYEVDRVVSDYEVIYKSLAH